MKFFKNIINNWGNNKWLSRKNLRKCKMSLTPTTIKHGRVYLHSLNCHDIIYGREGAVKNVERETNETKKIFKAV